MKLLLNLKKIYNNRNNNDTKLFYCNRIDKPIKNKFIKDEYCNIENDYYYLIKWIKVICDVLILIFLD